MVAACPLFPSSSLSAAGPSNGAGGDARAQPGSWSVPCSLPNEALAALEHLVEPRRPLFSRELVERDERCGRRVVDENGLGGEAKKGEEAVEEVHEQAQHRGEATTTKRRRCDDAFTFRLFSSRSE